MIKPGRLEWITELMGMSKCQKIFFCLGARHYLPQLFNVLFTLKGITDNFVFTWKLQIQKSPLYHPLLKVQSWFIGCSHKSRGIVTTRVASAERDDCSSGSVACVTLNTRERGRWLRLSRRIWVKLQVLLPQQQVLGRTVPHRFRKGWR